MVACINLYTLIIHSPSGNDLWWKFFRKEFVGESEIPHSVSADTEAVFAGCDVGEQEKEARGGDRCRQTDGRGATD